MTNIASKQFDNQYLFACARKFKAATNKAKGQKTLKV
jgi:hypothetical protein